MTTQAAAKKFDWMAVVFYPLAVVLMESFWVAPWLQWMGLWPAFRNTRPVLSLGTVILVLALSLVITRLAVQLQTKFWLIQTLIIGSGLIVMALVLGYEYADGYAYLSGDWFTHIRAVLGNTFSPQASPAALALPAIIYIWWRGITLGQSTSYFKDIYRTFLLGLTFIIILIVIWQLSSNSGKIARPGADIGVNVIAFFFFGLIAIAVSHLYNMRTTMQKEGAKLTSIWRWVPIMLGVIGGLVLVGFLIASALSPDFFTSVGHGIHVFLNALGKFFGWLLVPVVYAADGIAWVIRWFFQWLSRGRHGSDFSANLTGPPEQPEPISTGLSPGWESAIKWTAAVIIVAAVIFFLAKAVSRYRARRAGEDYEETRESLFSWKGLGADLKLWLNMLGDRFRRKPGDADLKHFDEDPAGRLDVRDIYRHLQWEANKNGLPRRRHETPDEYAVRLHHYPDIISQVDSLTQMYKVVRYGETDIPDPQVDEANALWRTTRDTLRKMRGS